MSWVYVGLVSALVVRMGYGSGAGQRVVMGVITAALTLSAVSLLEMAGLGLQWPSVMCLTAMGGSGVMLLSLWGWSPMYRPRLPRK